MKTRINLYASLLSLAILTGCSSSPVYDNDTTEIDNAAVKTAQVGSADVEIVPVISAPPSSPNISRRIRSPSVSAS